MKLKTLFKVFLPAALCFIWITSGQAQSMFLVHEDDVSPDMMMEYEALAKELNGYITEHGGSDMAYNTAMTNDMHYMYIMSIENLGAIDGLGKHWEALTDNVGEDKMNNLWNKMDKCYDAHRNYVIYLSEELSYYPSGEIMASTGTYRKWTRVMAHPDKIKDLTDAVKKWKGLYEKHNIQHGYRVYFGGMGTDLGTMIIVDYGEDLADLAKNEKMFQEKAGDEAWQLWTETTPAIKKIEEKYGQMRPDLSYNPK